MDKLRQKQLNCIGIICISIATLMLILVIVLPIMLKTKKTNDFTKKSLPNLENINLWAKFPGDLHSNLTHRYGIFNYKLKSESNKKSYQIELKTNISIKEEIEYSNFSQNEKENTIFFNTNRTYTYIDEQNDKETKINSTNMGLFETLETISYPPLYKVGINSIYYLLTRVFIEPDLFIRELFTYNMLKQIAKDETIIKDKILNNIPDEKIEKIISQDEKYIKYSLKSNHGLFEWIKIVGLKDKILKANWLYKLFELNEQEISLILEDDSSFLITEYKNFNSLLSEKFNCENEEKCGIELLFKQLINGTVISTLFSDLADYLSLNNKLETQYYPFDKTPEMNFYFQNEFKKDLGPKDDINYISYAPSKEQLDNLLNIDSENCLLSPNNSIYFLYINKTKDVTKEEKYYLNLSYNTIYFLSKYFYEFLPSIFLYPKVNNQNNKNLKDATNSDCVDPIAKTVSAMFKDIPNKTYKLMSESNLDLYDFILMSAIKGNLKKKTNYNTLNEICPIIMQKVLDDGKKVLKICSDENIILNSEESLYKWMEAFYCFPENNDDDKCNMYIINYIKNLVYITDEEINKIFSEDYLGGAFKYGLETIKNNYNCGNRCEEEGYLMKLQFWTGIVTSNPPDPLLKTDTIKDWFPDKFDYPPEISYYTKKYDYNKPINEQDIDFIINLVSDNEDKYDLDNSNSFVHLLQLEKEYTLYMKNKESSLAELVDFLIDVFLFKNEFLNDNENGNNIFTEYSTIRNLIQGNNEEDKKWVNILKSGNYFDNFKPDLTQTTGLDIGINLDTKAQDNFDFDYYGIYNKDLNLDKRKINSMNNLTILNFKKKEFDYLKNNYVNIITPLFNYESLLDDRKFSDGFQYDHNLKVIYYYDIISSRPLRFLYSKDVNYKDKIPCQQYILDINDLSADINEYYDKQNNNNNAMITQKLNKPFTISADFDILKKYEYNINDEKIDNYICLDPITDMVIDSNINLIYGVYTRNFGFINKNIENNEIYPVFLYQRKFDVEVNSYEEQFPGVTEYYRNMTVFIIIGIIVIIIFVSLAVFIFYYLHKKLNPEVPQEDMKLKESLTNYSEKNSNRQTGTQNINAVSSAQ